MLARVWRCFWNWPCGTRKSIDQIDGLIVQGVEIDALAGAAEGADDFGNEVRGSVRDADAETDAGAHGGLALFDDGGNGVAVLRL